MQKILIIYHSIHGGTKNIAQAIADGVESVRGVQAVLRTVPEVSDNLQKVVPSQPLQGAIYVEPSDLQECIGLAIGSGTRFGNMSASLKYFWDQTTPQWVNHTLLGKPASVFTSSSSMHGGQESTLLSMMIPLFHHGMVILGIGYDEPLLAQTSSGGTPYGATHVSKNNVNELTDEEYKIAFAQGKRLAITALKLAENK
jgi:NAD(P)H dehydrogenase (quinone)